ncbi:hypothetical protein GCM10023081_42780 [Arthrobacter ginkgonis]|uniref:ABC transporter domain-containing protein n=1 Tax=Arthrobacter ginkgonis TaxID=1630594 RepID=A0ABP7D7P5_9MICC
MSTNLLQAPHPPAVESRPEPLLSVRDLTIHNQFAGTDVVRGVGFDLNRGEILGLVGESGSGKTLTCRSLLGILPRGFAVDAGSVELFGEDVTGYSNKEWSKIRGTSISAIFQDPSSYLNPSIPVGKQVSEVFRVKGKLSRREAKTQTLELLRAVHLREPELVYGQYTHELSGGMLQRVLIASALALEPKILIADEATTALDVTVQAEILDLLVELQEAKGMSLIVVSHDLAVVAQLCSRVLVLKSGEIVEQGTTAEVLYSPRHEYTRLLVSEHNLYGLDRFIAGQGLAGQGLAQKEPAEKGAGEHVH